MPLFAGLETNAVGAVKICVFSALYAFRSVSKFETDAFLTMQVGLIEILLAQDSSASTDRVVSNQLCCCVSRFSSSLLDSMEIIHHLVVWTKYCLTMQISLHRFVERRCHRVCVRHVSLHPRK